MQIILVIFCLIFGFTVSIFIFVGAFILFYKLVSCSFDIWQWIFKRKPLKLLRWWSKND